jgi:hypothetical protein
MPDAEPAATLNPEVSAVRHLSDHVVDKWLSVF